MTSDEVQEAIKQVMADMRAKQEDHLRFLLEGLPTEWLARAVICWPDATDHDFTPRPSDDPTSNETVIEIALPWITFEPRAQVGTEHWYHQKNRQKVLEEWLADE